MGIHERTAASRRRLVAAGVAAGLLAGAAAGAALLTRAAPEAPGPRPTVLHAAPALVDPARDLRLTAATYCSAPDLPSCSVRRAVALVRRSGAGEWARVRGSVEGSVLSWQIPGSMVPSEGFSYFFRLTTVDGGQIAYPPGADRSAIRVVTSVGLPVEALGSVDWDRRARRSATVLRLRPGDGPGQVGFAGRDSEDGLQGPSGFDVAPGGDLLVADWVNRRIQRFDAAGTYVDEIAMPTDRPVDIAVGAAGRYLLTTLGTQAQAFELGPTGQVLGRYPIGYGVVSRIAAGEVPRVRVGSAQWVPVRASVGVPVSSEDQSMAQTASVPLADGAVGLSQEIGGRLAVVWTRPDGSRAGAMLRLPRGVAPGADYVVRPLPDGGAVMARGIWDPTHFGVLVVRFDASGRPVATRLLPEPTTRIVAPYSTVRVLPDGEVLLAVDSGEGIRIDRYGVR